MWTWGKRFLLRTRGATSQQRDAFGGMKWSYNPLWSQDWSACALRWFLPASQLKWLTLLFLVGIKLRNDNGAKRVAYSVVFWILIGKYSFFLGVNWKKDKVILEANFLHSVLGLQDEIVHETGICVICVWGAIVHGALNGNECLCVHHNDFSHSLLALKSLESPLPLPFQADLVAPHHQHSHS